MSSVSSNGCRQTSFESSSNPVATEHISSLKTHAYRIPTSFRDLPNEMVVEILSFLEPAQMLPLGLTNQRLNDVVMACILRRVFTTSNWRTSIWGIGFGSRTSLAPFSSLRFLRLSFYAQQVPTQISFEFHGSPEEVQWQMAESLRYLQTVDRVSTVDLYFGKAKPNIEGIDGRFSLFVDIYEQLQRCSCSTLCLSDTAALGGAYGVNRSRFLESRLNKIERLSAYHGFSSNIMQEWFMSRGPDALLLRTLRLTDNLAPLLPGLTLPKLQEVTLSGDPCPVDIMHGFLQRHPGLTLLNVACKPLAGDAVILNAAVRLPALCDLRLGAAWIPLLMPSAGTCPKLSSFTWNGSLDSGSNVADLQNLLHIVARHQSITTLWLPLWGFISVPGWLQIAEPRAETLMQSVKELYVTYSGKDAAGRMPAALGLFPVLVQVSMSLGKDLGRESNLVDGIVKVCKTVRTVSFGSIFGNEYSVIEKDDGVRTAKLTRKGQTYSDSI